MELYKLEVTAEEYNDISSGLKDWVVRKKDKNYSTDDLVTFIVTYDSRTQVGWNKYENHTYTRNTDEVFKIIYVQENSNGPYKEYCILGLKKLVVKEDYL